MHLKKKEIGEKDSQEHIFDFDDRNTTPCNFCSDGRTETPTYNHSTGKQLTAVHKTSKYASGEHTTDEYKTKIDINGKDTTGKLTVHAHSTYKATKYSPHKTYVSSSISIMKGKGVQSHKNSTIPLYTEQSTEYMLETLTEITSISPQPQSSDTIEHEEIKEILTEMGVSDENFFMLTATETEKETNENSTVYSTEVEFVKPGKPFTNVTKPIVFIVNNTGRKLEKVNETVLNNILHKTIGKSIEEVNLDYLDLHKLIEGSLVKEESRIFSTTTYKYDILGTFLQGSRNKPCSKTDFASDKQCICNVDSYLNILTSKLGKIVINEHDCIHFINLHEGIILNNKTEPLTKTKRSLLFLANSNPNLNIIEADIENIFSEDYQINQSDDEIVALPGSSVKIPCHNKADLLLENKGITYSWTFTKYASEGGESMPGGNNLFPIYKLEVKDIGNYTCSRSLSNGETEKYVHELEIITFPIYKIKFDIHYALKDSCSLTDGDILYSYLPKIFDVLLCGQTTKICSVNVDRPLCISNEEDSFLNVTVTTIMNSISEIITADLSNCDINCEMKAYANLVSLTYKHTKMIQEVNVLSKLGPEIDFLTNVSKKNRSLPPKVIITCKGGFGIEKTKQRLCVLCPQHTYSGDDEAFCKVCPTGQYQPIPGSILCLGCVSPVDDVRCLQMLYTDTKLFKIYVGVGFGMLLLLIMIICFWKVSGNSNDYEKIAVYEGSQKQRTLRRRPRDAEKGILEPLLKSPPKVPAPDF